MSNIDKIDSNEWNKVDIDPKAGEDIGRPSISYGQDVWRRLKKNTLSIIGIIIIGIITLMAIFGPVISKSTYFDQDLTMGNIPPIFKYYQIGETYAYVHKEFSLYEVTEKGKIIKRYNPVNNDTAGKNKEYDINGKKVIIDYSKSSINTEEGYILNVDGSALEPSGTAWNKNHIFGTDNLGRDLYIRVLYGARISLLVALVVTLVQFFIGVLYGGIAGYFGGRIDNVMMRIVDIISTVPLTLYVVLLMVVLKPGLKTIIIAMGTVSWVSMARLVRGQILSIKEQEFVLASKTIGSKTKRIMIKHLIPNAMGTIIVALTMNIPGAIFTESFLSFIGLGISAPQSSWGTLASDALSGLRAYPYQLFFPSLFICLTVLAYNFLGDGLRDALDPKMRK